VLNNLGSIYQELRRYGQAGIARAEAAELLRALARDNPNLYGDDFIESARTLAQCESDLGKDAEAKVLRHEIKKFRAAH